MARIFLYTGLLFIFYGFLSLFFTRATAGTLLTFFIGTVLVFNAFLDKNVRLKQLSKLCRILTAFMLLFFAGMCVFISLAGRSTSNYNEDAAIVLGAGIRGEKISPVLAARLDAAYDYLQANPKAILVVSGGRGAWESISEALAMQRYLVAKGVNESKILLEDKSANTYQNLRYSKKILDAYFPGGYSAVCITSRSHLYRGLRVGRKIGLNMTGVPAKIPFYLLPPVYLRETLALPNSVIRF